jgi:hypothetical protein
LPLTAGLRERFQYCNMMFVVASYAIERLTGMWLGHFLKREIWGKLGMKGTVSEISSFDLSLKCEVFLKNGFVLAKWLRAEFLRCLLYITDMCHSQVGLTRGCFKSAALLSF